MASGPWVFYDTVKLWVADGTFDLDAAGLTLTMGLVQSTSNYATLTNSVYGDLTNEVANANGYTTGGTACSGVTFTRTGGTAKFTCSPVTWTPTGSGITARAAFLYGNATLNGHIKPLIAYSVLNTAGGGTDVTAIAGQEFIVTPSASGVFTITG